MRTSAMHPVGPQVSRDYLDQRTGENRWLWGKNTTTEFGDFGCQTAHMHIKYLLLNVS